MNKRIWTNRLRYILISGLIALVGLGIGISCSKDASVSSISPTDDGVSGRKSVGTKPAVGGSNYADLNSTFLTLHKGDPPYTFLFLNFDEDSPMIREGMSSLEPELTPIERLWTYWHNTLQSISLTTPAYAHQYTGITHDSHSSLVAQAYRITIYDTNEGWGGGDPEVYVTTRIRLRLISDHAHEDKDDLPDVNELNVQYDDYEDLRSTHGVRQEWNNNRIRKLRVMEYDFASPDDQMGEWVNIHLPIPQRRKLLDPNTSVNGNDARVIIMKDDD